MIFKDVMFMFCQNLRKTVKLRTVAPIKYQIPARFNQTPNLYSSVFSLSKLKHCYKKGDFQHIQSAKFSTCFKLRNSVPEEENQNLVKITFIRPNGEEIVLNGKVGQTVMETAVQSEGVMQASCEGQLACTTCHVYVNPDIRHFFSETSLEEDDLLDNAPFCKPNSRLSCQLILTADMKEARFGLPAATTNMSVDSSSGKNKNKDENTSDNYDKKERKNS